MTPGGIRHPAMSIVRCSTWTAGVLEGRQAQGTLRRAASPNLSLVDGCHQELQDKALKLNPLIHKEKALQQKQPQQQQQKMHQAVSAPSTIVAPEVAMPPNIELQASEKVRFSPRRTRDVSAKLNQVGGPFGSSFVDSQGSQGAAFNNNSHPVDSRADVYDSRITVSLSSVMQTNVPKPFEITGKAPVHLNMPGGQWAQDEKYISGDLHTFHHSNISSKNNPGTACKALRTLGCSMPVKLATMLGVNGPNIRKLSTYNGGGRLDILNSVQLPFIPNKVSVFSNKVSVCKQCPRGLLGCRLFHKSTVCNSQQSQTNDNKTTDSPELQLTSRQKLKRAVKEYGATVIVFHVTISLASLGICYLLVSSGVDMTSLIQSLGINLEKAAEVADLPAPVDEVEVTSESVQQDVTGMQTTDPAATKDSNEGLVNTRRAAGAATFVVAYAVHKVFAPARIAVTLTATPFIVRHLRKIGFLKPPKLKID